MGPLVYNDDRDTSLPSRSRAWMSGTFCPTGIPVPGASVPIRSAGGSLYSFIVGPDGLAEAETDGVMVAIVPDADGAASPAGFEQPSDARARNASSRPARTSGGA